MHVIKSPKPRLFLHRRLACRQPCWASARRQTGASLLEVLIAILIMSFGIAGVALLMAATIQYNKTSQYQMVALQIATQLAESMRANTDGFMAGAYTKTDAYSSGVVAVSLPDCANISACTSSEIASIDKAQVANTLRLALPGGDFNVLRNGNRADIWIMWMEPKTATSLSMGTANCRAAAISGLGDPPRCFYMRAAL
jgi:type IV pilus assembly protein PilV